MGLSDIFVQSAGFNSLTSHQKGLVVFGGGLALLSYSALLVCASLSALSLVTTRFSRYWIICFILCAGATAGWMIFCAALFVRWGGIMVFRPNIIMFWLLAAGTLLSAFFAFKYPHK